MSDGIHSIPNKCDDSGVAGSFMANLWGIADKVILMSAIFSTSCCAVQTVDDDGNIRVRGLVDVTLVRADEAETDCVAKKYAVSNLGANFMQMEQQGSVSVGYQFYEMTSVGDNCLIVDFERKY